MKVGYRLALRLAMHLAMGLLLLGLIISVALTITTELIYPLEGNKQDTAVLTVLTVIIAAFVIIFGWLVGRPIFYMIGWIIRLTNGIYMDPDHHQKIYSSKNHQLKWPYHLYKELIDQLNILSTILERSRQERERLDKMKKEWIAGISHDLNTPLTYIKGYSAMLLSPRYNWEASEQTKFLTEIHQKAQHMEELIGDLNLSFRIEEEQLLLNRELLDLVEFIRRIVADVANDPRASGYNLMLETELLKKEMELDAKLLRRAVHNLLINAILHNPPGTKVRVSIIATSLLQIMITDNGRGMDEEAVMRLFQKYYRGTSTDTNSEGTGLGMAIAKQLVTAHGGDLSVTSKLHEGTSVTVTLPLKN